MLSYTGQQTINENALVGCQGNLLSAGGYNIQKPYFYPLYENVYHQWYPSYQIVTEKSKIEQGFKVVGKMLENKIITKELTIKEFIKLVNDIAEIL